MSRKYRFGADRHAHFVTFTVINWIDFFIRNEYRNVYIKAIKKYQHSFCLEVYGWCMMTSHIHLILRSESSDQLSETIKNSKGYTARAFHKMLLSEHTTNESHKRWLLWMMKQSGNYTSNTKGFQFWQQHNHPIELWSDEVFYQKMNYIHLNPVKEGFVRQPEDWQYMQCNRSFRRQRFIGAGRVNAPPTPSGTLCTYGHEQDARQQLGVCVEQLTAKDSIK